MAISVKNDRLVAADWIWVFVASSKSAGAAGAAASWEIDTPPPCATCSTGYSAAYTTA